MTIPIVLVHGWSDNGNSWATWKAKLRAMDPARQVLVCTYQSLTNEVTIKDIAEAFDRALVTQGGLPPGQAFDVMVHSTGMLVVRAWLAADPDRVKRLKHFVALAPASFGSPLAKKGRSWIGAIFRGNRHLGPDFLAAGDAVLDALELASPFTWKLAEQDVLGLTPCYDAGGDTPWVTVYCGTGDYTGLIRELVGTPGTDGTVRRAGCSLNIRQIALDMTESNIVARQQGKTGRVLVDAWQQVDMPVHLIGNPDGSDHVSHSVMINAPPDDLVNLVSGALKVETADDHHAWLRNADAPGRMARMNRQFQQFVIHALDERGDPITDYNLQISLDDGTQVEIFDDEVDVYSGDASYRCFHVDIAKLLSRLGMAPPALTINIIASSATRYVGYLGYGFEAQTEVGSWDASLTLTSAMLQGAALLRPYTTTLIRLYIERQVLPVDRSQVTPLLVWDPDSDTITVTETLVAASSVQVSKTSDG